MIGDAGPMVHFVMLLLLGFSLVSWFIIIQKMVLFRKARIFSQKFLDVFWKSKNLTEAYNYAQEMVFSPEATIFKSGYSELQKLRKSKTSDSGDEQSFEMRLAGLENLERVLRKAESSETSRFGKSLSVLATTGSATPFIGLFGTVWGIMNSFHEIGARGSASLAVVAPGISEALVATAAGLAVAIPAVIFYNFFSNKLAGLESHMESFSYDFLNLVERDLITR
jgi:biopolymer transport protein TolQ